MRTLIAVLLTGLALTAGASVASASTAASPDCGTGCAKNVSLADSKAQPPIASDAPDCGFGCAKDAVERLRQAA